MGSELIQQKAGDPANVFETIPNGDEGDVLTQLAGDAKGMRPPLQIGGSSWVSSTILIVPPSSGEIRWNNITQASATKIYLHKTNNLGVDVSDLLSQVGVGDALYFQEESNVNIHQSWTIDVVLDQTTYFEYDVTLLESAGGDIANLKKALISNRASGGTNKVLQPQVVNAQSVSPTLSSALLADMFLAFDNVTKTLKTVNFKTIPVVAKGLDAFEIGVDTDFPNAPIGDVIIVDSGVYTFIASVFTIYRFEKAAGATVHFRAKLLTHNLISSNTGTLFSNVGGGIVDFRISFMSIVLTGVGAKFFDLQLGLCELLTFIPVSAAAGQSLGSIQGGTGVLAAIIIRNSQILNFAESISIDNAVVFSFSFTGLQTSFETTNSVFTFGKNIIQTDIQNATLIYGPGESAVDIDPASIGNVKLNDIVTPEGKTFYRIGVNGAITLITDESVGATAISGVSFPGGVARFAFTGPTLYTNQEVINSTFVTNTNFNGTFTISDTDGTSWYEVSSIITGATEAGSFLSNSIEITSATHGRAEASSLLIEATLYYNGGSTIYNSLTNTFRVNRAYNVLDPNNTGNWTTDSLTQKDPRVIARDNPGQANSKNIACTYVNNNSTVVGAIINNTFTDIIFGTAGNALIPCSNIELWTLVDELNGTLRYDGIEPFSGTITFDVTAFSSGGSEGFRFKWLIDKGASFVDLDDPVEAFLEIASNASSTSKHLPVSAVFGDLIKPQITRNGGNSGVTVSYFTASVF